MTFYERKARTAHILQEKMGEVMDRIIDTGYIYENVAELDMICRVWQALGLEWTSDYEWEQLNAAKEGQEQESH